MIASKKFDLSIRDVVHGFITAALTAASSGLIGCMGDGTLPTIAQLKTYAIIGLCGGFAYLVKKFLTNSEGLVTKGEPKETLK